MDRLQTQKFDLFLVIGTQIDQWLHNLDRFSFQKYYLLDRMTISE